MRTLTVLNQATTKVGDTATVWSFLLKDGAQRVYMDSKNSIKAHVTNNSGYVGDATVTISNNLVLLDFNQPFISSLPAGTYGIQLDLTTSDGDVAKYPTDSVLSFELTKDAMTTEGELVPTVTFQQVLDGVGDKLTKALASGDYKGPKGDTGATGPTGATGKQGLTGPAGKDGTNGKDGKDGTGVSIKGSAESADKLPTTSNTTGDAYLVAGDMYVWDGSAWKDVGKIQGPAGTNGVDATPAITNSTALTTALTPSQYFSKSKGQRVIEEIPATVLGITGATGNGYLTTYVTSKDASVAGSVYQLFVVNNGGRPTHYERINKDATNFNEFEQVTTW